MPTNQTRGNTYKGYLEYHIEFDILYNDTGNPIKIFVARPDDNLYYTDEPPAAGSVPLTVNDIPAGLRGGKKQKTQENL